MGAAATNMSGHNLTGPRTGPGQWASAANGSSHRIGNNGSTETNSKRNAPNAHRGTQSTMGDLLGGGGDAPTNPIVGSTKRQAAGSGPSTYKSSGITGEGTSYRGVQEWQSTAQGEIMSSGAADGSFEKKKDSHGRKAAVRPAYMGGNSDDVVLFQGGEFFEQTEFDLGQIFKLWPCASCSSWLDLTIHSGPLPCKHHCCSNNKGETMPAT